jgi:hypothetical protein
MSLLEFTFERLTNTNDAYRELVLDMPDATSFGVRENQLQTSSHQMACDKDMCDGRHCTLQWQTSRFAKGRSAVHSTLSRVIANFERPRVT